MTHYNTNALIEQVKYGDSAPAYGGDLRADIIKALDDLERLQDLTAAILEAWPSAEDFGEIGGFLLGQPKVFAAFEQIIKRQSATFDSLSADAQQLGVDI